MRMISKVSVYIVLGMLLVSVPVRSYAMSTHHLTVHGETGGGDSADGSGDGSGDGGGSGDSGGDSGGDE